MNSIQAVSNSANARVWFETHLRKMGPGYAATINGVSAPLRILPAVQPAAPVDTAAHYRHVIDTFA